MPVSTVKLNGTTLMTVNDTTATQGDVINKYFYAADGTKTLGTASGGITPTGNINITQAGQTDVTQYETATVSAGTEGTPSATKGTVSNHAVTVTPSVTNASGWIDGGTHTGTAVTVSASELVSGTYTVDSSGTKDVTNYASASIPSGTAGTPSASKGSVSNHAISVTPSVTNTTGWITGSTKTGTAVSVTASELVSGTYTVSASGTHDVTNYASASVPSASFVYPLTIPIGTHEITVDSSTGQIHSFVEVGGNVSPISQSGFASSTDTVFAYNSGGEVYNLPTQGATTITPSTSSQTAVTAGKFTTGAVTVAAMPTGTAGTPTATKGTVSNHSVSVTPSVTNTSGYITGSTKTGTAVTVSASELVSGSQTITQNGTVDVTNLASVVVDVQGGGGSSAQVDTVARSPGGDDYTAIFTGLKGQPTSFYVNVDVSVSTTAQAAISAVVYDGSSIHTQTVSNTTNAQVSYVSTGVSYTYSNGTLTVTSTGPVFVDDDYALTYTYGGSASDIDTFNVQVGSGATSITFTGLDDEPIAWSCIFKSNFSTSSGYQRVIATGYNGTNVIGLAMDSAAHPSNSYWTQSYNNGSLTISSQSTNAGGYFHQPGYYQLTAVYGDIEPQEIDVVPLSVTTNGTYTAPSGQAYSPVTVNVPSGGSATVTTTTWSNTDSTATTHTFTGLSGTPKAAFLRCTSSLSRSSSSSNYYVADMRWTGTAAAGNSFRRSNGTYANVTSGYSFSASGTSLTVTTTGTSTSNPGSFYNGTYELTYIY